MTENPPLREDLPHWDLSNVYPGLDSPEFARALSELRDKLDTLEAFTAGIGAGGEGEKESPDPAAVRQTVESYLAQANALLPLHTTLGAYVSSFVTTNSFDTLAKRLESQLEMLAIRLRKQQTRFQSWLGRVAGILPKVLAPEGPAEEHAFYLTEVAGQSRYLMSEAEETLAAELSLSGSTAWSKLQGVVSSQLTVPFALEGETKTLAMTALQNFRSSPDAALRRRAYEAELAAWEAAKEPFAAALNGVKGTQTTLDKRRGRVDALHEALDQGRIDRQILETMLQAMQESFPLFREYLKAKAKRLGEEVLPWWDIFAPLGKLERRYTFAEAQDFVTTQFATFSPRLATLAQRAFASRWIDAEPRVGKRGGAFCMYLPLVEESRVLTNFDGSLNGVITIAHELGHAYNNLCWAGKPALRRITPMTLAETSSTFCETIVAEAALRDAPSAEEELAILEIYLIGATQVIVDITSRFLFEKEVFERREKAELSAEELCEIMVRTQEATYGEGLDCRYLHPYTWAWKPHYYYADRAFYNFPYAFGLLFGTGLYAVYRQRGPAFVPEYEALLASTGEASAADLALRFGIDIRQPAFWRASLALIGERIQRYLTL